MRLNRIDRLERPKEKIGPVPVRNLVLWYIGAGCGAWAGIWIAIRFGWQSAIVPAGILGILLGGLIASRTLTRLWRSPPTRTLSVRAVAYSFLGCVAGGLAGDLFGVAVGLDRGVIGLAGAVLGAIVGAVAIPAPVKTNRSAGS